MKIKAIPWTPKCLIDDLQDIINEESDNYLNTRRTTLEMALAYLKEHFYGWISVDERLPEEKTLVLCIGARGGMFLGKTSGSFRSVYCGKPTVYFSVPNARCGREATHWMPLPEPPQEEKDNG